VSKFRQKTQGMTKQILGQMLGDEALVREGKEQERGAEQAEQRHEDTACSAERERPPH
jgi:uncharacterized protein YjbJ (UPF0337 family)